MKHVLVTGANGFVGRHVCRKLLQENFRVRAACRRDASSLPHGVEIWRVGDVQNDLQWDRACMGMDAVVHLIARTHIMRESSADPLAEYRAVNVGGTRRLLDSCRRTGVGRFIYLSSIKAVGEGRPTPYREDDSCQPEDPYGISKLEAEELVASARGDIEFVILRPPLVYGPGVGGNFARIVNAVRRGMPLPLAGIENVRSLIYVENLADAVAASLDHPAASDQTFHVADDEPLSTPRLIEYLAEAMGRRPQLFRVPHCLLRLMGTATGMSAELGRLVGSLTLDTTRIGEMLRWRPPMTTSVAIERTVNSRSKIHMRETTRTISLDHLRPSA